MDFVLLLLQASVGFAASIFLYSLLLAWPNWITNRKNKNGLTEAPQPPGRWPIIGHLHLFREPHSLLQTLGSMADKYGPAITLRLGLCPTLVISSCELARECFTANDKAFATRPLSAAGEYMGYNYAMFGFAPYGPYWREIRKMATLHVLSNGRLDSLRHVRAAEVDRRVKELYCSWAADERPVKIDLKEWCADLTHNVMLQMVVGKRFLDDDCEGRRFKKAINRFFSLLISSFTMDAVPLLGWIDWGGQKREMKETAEEMDRLLSSWLEQHRSKKKGESDEGKEEDFMDVMLSTMKDLQIEGYDEDTVIKATCMALILGGTDTTSMTLAWALCFTLAHPLVLKKAQEELAAHVGEDRNVDESDIKNLVYLQAIVKETLRFAPAAPFVVTHEAMKDCTIGGFHVPAGTQLLVNLRKMQQDPSVWPNPSEFQPERFLTSHAHVDVRGQHFECIPFGSGRRMCPGISFALHVIHLALARVVHGFDTQMERVSQAEFGRRLRFADPSAPGLQVLLIPRLPRTLYE
ncbi:cytochrome P450 CYP82D47-like [Aristolochia californica]|uniref:cytochrome P450 CYP82D47-like n=1 Tax=Aristolochia californica TaxID=171875 RepID=UPI0035DF0A85